MLRASTDPGAVFYAVYVTPGNGIAVQFRNTQDSQVTNIAFSGAAPAYLKVTRAGTVFNAYTSADGVTWTQLQGSTIRLTNLTGTLLAGLAVTAHNGAALSTAVFQSVVVG